MPAGGCCKWPGRHFQVRIRCEEKAVSEGIVELLFGQGGGPYHKIHVVQSFQDISKMCVFYNGLEQSLHHTLGSNFRNSVGGKEAGSLLTAWLPIAGPRV